IGGSTNAPIHLNAIARHIGVELSLDDWEQHGADIPLLVNLQPAGKYLGEDYYRAGGVPAVMAELLRAGLLDGSAATVNGRTIADNIADAVIEDTDVIRPLADPLMHSAGLSVLTGNLFDGAVMKLSVISDEFRERYLSDPNQPGVFEGKVVVFDGPEDYHHGIDDPALGIDENTILVMRGAGPVGYPGGAEVVNMRPPAALIRAGVHALPCLGDGRQSGTSGSPSILNASPEAAVGGGLALLRSGDRLRIDLNRRTADVLLDDAELAQRRADLAADDSERFPASQTPWQEIQRAMVGQFDTGAVLEPAIKYQRIAQLRGLPRDSH
ncbi:MAG TPA: dihydroxy-acid dehydratase, partial [Sphingomonas sp.]|nr:dihydroxy-acid dehydratase [Sphingomonas sp.]